MFFNLLVCNIYFTVSKISRFETKNPVKGSFSNFSTSWSSLDNQSFFDLLFFIFLLKALYLIWFHHFKRRLLRVIKVISFKIICTHFPKYLGYCIVPDRIMPCATSAYFCVKLLEIIDRIECANVIDGVCTVSEYNVCAISKVSSATCSILSM